MRQPVSRVVDPYVESSVHYLVVDIETMQPDIVEVDKHTPGSFRTLQEAKSFVMQVLRDRIDEGTESLQRVRTIGIEIARLM
jgi:hypothetical protein